MDSEDEALLFYSKVHWVSKGSVVNRVFELLRELKLFLGMQGKADLLSHFNEYIVGATACIINKYIWTAK